MGKNEEKNGNGNGDTSAERAAFELGIGRIYDPETAEAIRRDLQKSEAPKLTSSPQSRESREQARGEKHQTFRDTIARIEAPDKYFIAHMNEQHTEEGMARLLLECGFITNPNYLAEVGRDIVRQDFARRKNELKEKYKV